MKVNGGVVIGGEKRNTNVLIPSDWKEKVHQVDAHTGKGVLLSHCTYCY